MFGLILTGEVIANKEPDFWRGVDTLFVAKSKDTESVEFTLIEYDLRSALYSVSAPGKAEILRIVESVKIERSLKACTFVLAKEVEVGSSYQAQLEITCY